METRNNSYSTGDEPIYNIGVVSRMTGIPVATLRVWERRYKFPKATRTSGGHRLYSEQELVRLRWVKASIDEGMQTSQAIRALRSKERSGRIPELGAAPALAVTPASVSALAKEAAPVSDALMPLAAFRDRLLTALLNHDLVQADQLLGDALAVYPLETLILDVLRPALVAIGEGWAEGRINVATEHLASQFIRQRLMLWLISGPPVHPVRPVVLACAPDEWHEVGLLMLGVLLRRRRWPVAYLGQAVPLADLAKFVREMEPQAVVLVAMTERPARQLVDVGQWLPEAVQFGRPQIVFGGAAFVHHPELIAAIPGAYLGPTLAQSVDALERLLLEHPGG